MLLSFLIDKPFKLYFQTILSIFINVEKPRYTTPLKTSFKNNKLFGKNENSQFGRNSGVNAS